MTVPRGAPVGGLVDPAEERPVLGPEVERRRPAEDGVGGHGRHDSSGRMTAATVELSARTRPRGGRDGSPSNRVITRSDRGGRWNQESEGR